MRKLRLYLSGPMTGIPNFNRPLFRSVAESLRKEGHFVVNPTELDSVPEEGSSAFDAMLLWKSFIVRDVAVLMTSDFDAVAVLPGWMLSRGARMEVTAAMMVGIKIVDAFRLKRISVTSIPMVDLEQEIAEEEWSVDQLKSVDWPGGEGYEK